MAKRFLDTGLWSKPWFRELGAPEKAAWLYLLTNCDAVGVWDADKKLAEFCIGSPVDWEKLAAAANGNIEVLENRKWWLVDFCRYQYGTIKPESVSKVQATLHALLLRHGLWERYVATVAPTVQEKEKEKEKAKDKDKEKAKDKDKEKEEEKDLRRAVEAAFRSKNDGIFDNIPMERKNIIGIVAKARLRAPGNESAFIAQMMEALWKLKNGRDAFWRSQPFLPSTLNADKLWSRVLESMRREEVDPAVAELITGAAK